ncbi:conserved exported hypothetical protein [Flavobacterium sp. 9AF]|uniref:serine hydrolase domain-containing protein n=1 Tax=Flavobacterium sp. 9AF TaxID=2653142 RepID=UPI0012F46850|nr:serine hydrolase domain-containing protein [Flavobacterium sp. 9AF]VXB71391.1 conserved exported hypothetical protein [Flavobacterium sp. 9AF]
MKKVISIFVFLLTTVCLAQKATQFVDSVRIVYKIPELSYAVVDSKKVLEIHALGKHSILLNDSATVNDRFHLGSNTKAMTAFIIAKYVEKGKLKWTTRFFDLFPEWKSQSRLEYANITLQELLSHKARIQPFQGENDPEIPNFKGSKKEKRMAFGKFVLTTVPVDIDEENPFVYSNAGYTLATLMLEKVTHKTWEQLVNKVFNKDLKLNVQFSWPENQKNKDTWGHSFENDELIPVPSTTDYHLDYTEPSGDLNCDLKDYIQFIQLNLRGLQGEDNYLKASTYKFIHKGIENYSLGWYNIYENEKELSTHSGTAGTYYTLVHIDRIQNKAYIIFTNSYSIDTKMGVRIVMRKLKEFYENN